MLPAAHPKVISQINAPAIAIQLCLQAQNRSTQWLQKGPLLSASMPFHSLPAGRQIHSNGLDSHRTLQEMTFTTLLRLHHKRQHSFLLVLAIGNPWKFVLGCSGSHGKASCQQPVSTWKRTRQPLLGLPMTVALTDTLMAAPQRLRSTNAHQSAFHTLQSLNFEVFCCLAIKKIIQLPFIVAQ